MKNGTPQKELSLATPEEIQTALGKKVVTNTKI